MRVEARWRHVIFDLDGTLVDTVEDIAAALNEALSRFGFATHSLDAIRAMVGEGARRLVEQALPQGDAQVLEKVLHAFLQVYRSHPVVRSRLYPGVAEMLRALRAGGVVASVLTNKPADLSEDILQRLGISGFLAAVCGGDTLARRKPDPDGVLYLCERVGVDTRETLLVGDSGIDRATAANAGVAFCAALWGYRSVELEGVELAAKMPADLERLVLSSSNGSAR